MDYLSTTDTAQKWGISVQRVRVLCQEDRIPGVIRVGKCYMVPANAGKPADYRRLDSVDLEAAKATPEFDMLKRCYENVPELFYLVDPATYRISYMNRTATEVFGKEGLEQICYDFVCKSDTPCAYCRIQEQVDWNVTFYHKQSERYFALFGRRIQVDGREFLGVNGFDTTNEVRLRNDVELERNRYREIVNFIPAGLGIYKKVGDDILMVWTNRYLTERTGIPGNRLLNSTIESQIEYIYPDDIDPLLNTLRSCFQTTREQNSSFRIWDYNTKQYRWFRMNVVYGNWKEGCQYAYANYLDVTEQQNMLEELQRSKALLEKAVAHAKVHYIRYEARTGLTTINREVAELYGFSSVMDDYPRQLCRPDALYPADYRLYCDKFEEVRGGRKKEVVFNARIRDHSEGEYIWRKVRFTGSYDLEGKLVRIDGVSQDVNEYLEQEKRGMAE